MLDMTKADVTMSGSMDGSLLKIGIVVSRFNDVITKSLLDGALTTLLRYGVKPENIQTLSVPGAFELPLVAQRLATNKQVDAVITLGCVIRGATTHYDYVCSQAAAGIAKVSLDASIPVVFGVVTTETLEQALDRAGGKVGNKGADAALTAIEMANLLKKL